MKNVDIDKTKLEMIKNEKIQAGLQSVGFFLEGDIKESFQPGSGREYIVHGKIHRASAPGEPPAVLFGRLRSSIASDLKKNSVKIGTNVEYAKWLEFGTSRMEARPFLRPALERNRREIPRIFKEGAEKW